MTTLSFYLKNEFYEKKLGMDPRMGAEVNVTIAFDDSTDFNFSMPVWAVQTYLETSVMGSLVE